MRMPLVCSYPPTSKSPTPCSTDSRCVPYCLPSSLHASSVSAISTHSSLPIFTSLFPPQHSTSRKYFPCPSRKCIHIFIRGFCNPKKFVWTIIVWPLFLQAMFDWFGSPYLLDSATALRRLRLCGNLLLFLFFAGGNLLLLLWCRAQRRRHPAHQRKIGDRLGCKGSFMRVATMMYPFSAI